MSKINEKVKKMNDFIESHKQFAADSLLYNDIMEALGCNHAEAKFFAGLMCNVVSFYAILYSMGYLSLSFSDFLKDLIAHNDVTKQRPYWINSIKENIINRLKIPIQLEIYKIEQEKPIGFYQIKISNYKGTHFMAGYVENENEELKISDTSFRGIGIGIEKGLAKDNKILFIKHYKEIS